MGKWLLRFVRLLNPLFRRQGVDVDRLYAIVELKMLMDTRRVYMNWKQGQQRDNKNHLTTALVLYSLFGLFMSIAIFQIPSIVMAMVIFHAYIIFMMAMTLITDFSAILLDTTDNQILLPRPVNSKTLFLARVIHVLLYLFQFSLAVCLAPILVVFYKFGWLTGMGAVITSQLTVVIAVFFTYILYLLMLRFSTEQRLKDIVTYFQIGMTLLFTIGYQVIPRMVDMDALTGTFTLHWYSYLLPPVWMALALEALNEPNFDLIHIAMILLSVGSPIVLFRVMNNYLAPAFAALLANLNNQNEKAMIPARSARSGRALSSRLSGVFCSSAVERGAFDITWKITARDKAFRLQFYPSLGYIPVFVFLIVFNGGRDMEQQLQALPTSTKFLWLIYLPLFSIAGSLSVITFNENFQASWLYHSLPVNRPGMILSGALKAMIVKFFLPVYFVFFCISVYIWGLPVMDDFLYGFVSSLLSLFSLSMLSDHYLPFSRQPNVKQQSGKFIQVLLQVIIVAILVGIHFLLLREALVMYAVILLCTGVVVIMVKNLQAIKWNKISV